MENYDKEKIKEAIENIRATISEEGRNQTARSNYYDKTRIIEIERYLKNSKIQNLNAIIDQCDLINANRIESEILSQIEDFIRDNDYNTRVGTHYYYDTTFVNEYYGEVGHKAVQESKILQAFIPIKLKISTNRKEKATKIFVHVSDFADFMLEQYNKSKQLSKSLTEKLNEILTIEDEEINSRWEHNPINDTYSHKKNEVTK